MLKVAKGDSIKVHYTGRLDDGTVFDTSDGRDPLEFTVGAGMMIAGFDAGVVGMALGETKTIKIPADQAYGVYRDDMVAELGLDEVPVNFKLAKGMVLQLRSDDGATMMVTIKDLTDTHVTMDGNHSLAGKDLTFDIEIIAIN